MEIFDFRWDDKKEKPYFQYLKNGELHIQDIEFDTQFCVTVEREQMNCVGRIQGKKYLQCSQSFEGNKKCELCKKAEDYFPCQFCNGFNCDRFRNDKIENCDADHMVYLALFSNDIVKIGVSRFSRMKARQFEQGTHYTRLLIKGVSGVTARRIEQDIGRKISICQRKYSSSHARNDEIYC